MIVRLGKLSNGSCYPSEKAWRLSLAKNVLFRHYYIVQELWDHRADLAEQAIEERHSARLWGLPLTNLGLIAWPPDRKSVV